MRMISVALAPIINLMIFFAYVNYALDRQQARAVELYHKKLDPPSLSDTYPHLTYQILQGMGTAASSSTEADVETN